MVNFTQASMTTMDEYSGYTEEQECLITPGNTFYVTNVNEENGYVMIVLKSLYAF